MVIGGVVVCRLITQRLETALAALVCVQNFIDIVCEREKAQKYTFSATSKVDSTRPRPTLNGFKFKYQKP